MKTTAGTSAGEQRLVVMITVAYLASVVLFFVASLFPRHQVWGISWWSYFPVYVKIGLFLVALAVGVGNFLLFKKGCLKGREEENENRSVGTYLLFVSAITVVFVFSFILFRGTIHFLGDGYQLLTRLAEGMPAVKMWDRGTTFVTQTVFSLLEGQPEVRALKAYRIVSIDSGLFLLVVAALFSFVFYKDNLRRLVFFLGLFSGGYMLLFFGYVENYALSTAVVMLYTLIGVAVLTRRLPRWWLLPPLVLAWYLHLFTLTLLPSAVYLFLRETRFADAVSKIIRQRKLFFVFLFLFLGIGVYYFLYSHFYFFTFALLPLMPDRFTIAGDWLFSLKHIVDVANLLLMLVPGLLVLVVLLFTTPQKMRFSHPATPFLMVLTFSTLAAVYVFNPGIGMPRNWDLFSIVAVPLTVWGYTFLIESARTSGGLVFRAVPVIALSFLLLVPRVVSQVIPEVGIAHFRNYLVHDKIRNRNARRLLIDYYKQRGDTAAAQAEQQRALEDFPEARYNEKARALIRQGELREATRYLQEVLATNPLSYDAYANLGICRLKQGDIDSALTLLQIADGLNPYNASTVNNLGTVYLRKKEYTTAEKYFRKSLAIDRTEKNAMAGLASVYLQSNEFDKSLFWLEKLFQGGGLSYEYFRQAGDAFLERQAFSHASRAYSFAVKLGLPADYVEKLRRKHPQLRLND